MADHTHFSCPECQMSSKVLETASLPPASIRRRYECRVCKHRWSTIEFLQLAHRSEQAAINRALTPELKLELNRLVANKLSYLAHKLRKGEV